MQALAKSYNIQVDNLCQFLPQDRVKEFSNLGPQMKLMETERAAAHPSMLQAHKKLIDLDKQCRSTGKDLEADKTQLKQLEDRQASLKQDVDRLKERKDVENQIELLNKARPFVIYRDLRTEAKKAKTVFKQAGRELDELERELQPAMERPKKKSAYHDKVKKVARERDEEFKAKVKELEKIKTIQLPKLETKITEIKQSQESERNSELKRREDVDRLKQEIQKIQKKIDEGAPPPVDLQYYNRLVVG